LAAQEGGAAAAEFQKILDRHRLELMDGSGADKKSLQPHPRPGRPFDKPGLDGSSVRIDLGDLVA